MTQTEVHVEGVSSGSLRPVSVIIPCFNHEKYIAQALRSAARQSYPSIEIVVIDDGSSDGSVEMLRQLAEELDFKLICQENMGVCKTLNRAIREASTGAYVALLASDDIWRPDKLKLQMDALHSQAGSEFCFSQAREFADEVRIDVGRVFPRKCRTGHILGSVFVRQHVPAGTMLFSRRLFDALGGFDETLKEEDWDFVIRCAAATPFAAVDQPLLYYRAHEANTMRTRDRSAIFQQKAKILAKNMHLVSPSVWLVATAYHFAHDIIWHRLKRLLRGGARQETDSNDT